MDLLRSEPVGRTYGTQWSLQVVAPSWSGPKWRGSWQQVGRASGAALIPDIIRVHHTWPRSRPECTPNNSVLV